MREFFTSSKDDDNGGLEQYKDKYGQGAFAAARSLSFFFLLVSTNFYSNPADFARIHKWYEET